MCVHAGMFQVEVSSDGSKVASDKRLAESRTELHTAMHYGKRGEGVCSINKYSLRAALQGRWVSVYTFLKTPPTHHLVYVEHTWWPEMIIYRFISDSVSGAVRLMQGAEFT